MLTRHWRIALFMLCLLVGALGVNAQELSGTLTIGQPTAANLEAGQTLTYGYTLAESSTVTFQVFGDTAQPTFAISRDGEEVFFEGNSAGTAILSLTPFLSAGTYTVELGSVNNAAGTVVVVIQSEVPVTATPLTLATPVSGEVSSQSPFALYSFNSLGEQAFLYVESASVDSGASVLLVNSASGNVIGTLSSEVAGGRFRIPAGSVSYQVEVSHSGSEGEDAFTLCLASVSAGGCEAGTLPVAPTQVVVPTEILPPTAVATEVVACTLTPSGAGGANIRQSATTSSILLGSMPGGAVADVIGISPDGTFYNILYNGINGWVALSVSTVSGNCAGLPVNNPPAVIFPTNTPTPIPPTATLIPPSPTASGPCLITFTGDVLVYQTPIEDPSYIQDEVTTGYELIPIGRLADNSWWKTNYGSAWIRTSNFGGNAHVSGNCNNLPIVSP